MTYSTQQVLNMSVNSSKLFFGSEGHGIARYDQVRHPVFLKIDERMKSLFWRPSEVDVSQEKASFNKMTPAEQFVFTSNLSRQILLDSVQGRAPSLVFLPHCTDPSLENCIQTWSFFETIHSESYTHIIRAIYPNPSAVFEMMPSIHELAVGAKSVTEHYNAAIANPTKENIYLALIAANALEALRFYVSFACTFSFGERGMIEGCAKIVKFIARDEIQHLALVQTILKKLPQDDPDFIQIIADNADKARAIFDETAEQEKAWGRYIFSKGSILVLNEKIIDQYIDFINDKQKRAIGIHSTGTRSRIENPIPWIEKWYSGSKVQQAPQETEITSYLVGAVENDVESAQFSL